MSAPAPQASAPCPCGKGDVVKLADGSTSCTNTLARYQVMYGKPYPVPVVR